MTSEKESWTTPLFLSDLAGPLLVQVAYISLNAPFVTIPSRIMKLLPKNPTTKTMDTKTTNEAFRISIWNIQKSRLRSFLLFSPQIFLTWKGGSYAKWFSVWTVHFYLSPMRHSPHVWKDHRHRLAKMFQVQPTLGHPDGKEQTIHYTGIPLFWGVRLSPIQTEYCMRHTVSASDWV